MLELTAVQLFVISTLATFIVYFLNWIAKVSGWKPGRGILTGFLYLISFGLSFVWAQPTLPPLPPWGGDIVVFVPMILDYLAALLTLAGPVVAFATLIYNTLGKLVFDKLADRLGLRVWQ